MMNLKTARSLACVVAITLAAITGCAHKPAPVTDSPAHSSVTTTTQSSSAANGAAGRKEVQEETVSAAIASPGAAEGEVDETRKAGAGASQGLVLEALYFNYDSASLSREAREVAYRNFQLLSSGSKMKIRLEGHCDERGSDEYNLALGEKRAVAAKKYLETLGLSADRVSTVSYGKERPAVEGSSEDAWAKNRRVEFVVDR
ncbi:peptidoglycan-associated lipoprotein Pal [Geomonas sp. RF6]|uniref:peptidoglycan-associated lipoprotein Pal n=1 Tax=Geomonas sp. RF6 TaxID=2897342 RepID=UPI001E4D23A5|nr:peptidoglycan-associated lipoprotein Pal [Geomonas sp. RF6]UFS70693.1 peptidoglycan-associated lipoprotein Pal [Geomonas sp. RF6]